MALLPLITLILGLIKLGLEISNYLKAHPELTAESLEALQKVTEALEHAQDHAQRIEPPHVEAP